MTIAFATNFSREIVDQLKDDPNFLEAVNETLTVCPYLFSSDQLTTSEMNTLALCIGLSYERPSGNFIRITNFGDYVLAAWEMHSAGDTEPEDPDQLFGDLGDAFGDD